MKRLLLNLFLWLSLLEAVGLLLAVNGITKVLWSGLERISLLSFFIPVLLFLGAVLSPGIPKRFFIAPFLIFVWSSLGLVPLFPHFSFFTALQIASVLNILAVIFSLDQIRRLNLRHFRKHSLIFWGLPNKYRATNSHSLKWGALGLAGISLGIVFYLLWAVPYLAHNLTAGFLRIERDQLSTEWRSYQKGDTTVHLVGMVHMANPDFYKKVFSDLSPERSIILTEGVEDEQGLLTGIKMPYERFSSASVVAQPKVQAEMLQQLQSRNADVDVSQFSETSLQILRAIGQVSGEQGTASTRRGSLFDLSDFFYDLIELRNNHLLTVLREELDHFQDIVIPWGAAHMPGILQELETMGFEETERSRVPVVRWTSFLD